MSHQELLKLYGLKGVIAAMMSIAKGEIRANHRVRRVYSSRVNLRWLEGRSQVAVRHLRDLNHLRRQLNQIIKEAEGE